LISFPCPRILNHKCGVFEALKIQSGRVEERNEVSTGEVILGTLLKNQDLAKILFLTSLNIFSISKKVILELSTFK